MQLDLVAGILSDSQLANEVVHNFISYCKPVLRTIPSMGHLHAALI